MSRPIIGIIPLVDLQRDSLWMIPGYMDGLSVAGALPLMLPLARDDSVIEQMCSMCDGILFTGGQDVDPSLYGHEKSVKCGECCTERDIMEEKVLGYCLKKKMPFLGICRGIQFINACLGGTLYQDLPSERPSDTEHHMSPPYNRHVHKVGLVDGSPLAELLDKREMGVNSYHHQAIRDVSPELEVMAFSEDGLVEAVRHPGIDFGWAVQWHPELSYREDPDSMKILKAFSDAAGEYGTGKQGFT